MNLEISSFTSVGINYNEMSVLTNFLIQGKLTVIKQVGDSLNTTNKPRVLQNKLEFSKLLRYKRQDLKLFVKMCYIANKLKFTITFLFKI